MLPRDAIEYLLLVDVWWIALLDDYLYRWNKDLLCLYILVVHIEVMISDIIEPPIY